MTTTSNKDSRLVIRGDDLVNPIEFNQLVEAPTHINIYADDDLLPLVSGVDYSISGILDPTGVTITLLEPTLSRVVDYWVVLHVPPIDQNSDLSVGGPFGLPYEAATDAVVRRLQAVSNAVDRAIKTPRYETDEPPTLLTEGYAAGETLVFDENGNLVPGADQSDIEGAQGYALAAAASAEEAATSAGQAEAAYENMLDVVETVVPDKLQFTGDGVTTTFLLGRNANALTTSAVVAGVPQITGQWSISGTGAATSIVFVTAPPVTLGGANIEVTLGGQASFPATPLAPNSVTTPILADDAVTNPKIADDAVSTDKLEPSLRTNVNEIIKRSSRMFGSKASMQAAQIEATTEWAALTGTVNQGDGGAMLLRKVLSPAAGYPAVVSADGANWEFVPTDWSVTFEQFGAVGDGTTDDYAACQAAVDFIYARGGGIIRLGWNKVYALSDTLFVWQRVRLIGVAGAWSNQYSTGVGSAAPVPLGSAFFLLTGVNKDAVQFRFNVFNSGGTMREVGNNRVVSDWRHHGGAVDVCFWGNRSGVGTPPTSKTRNTAGNACSVYGARYVWLERNAGMFGAEHGFEFLARDYTADFGAGGVVGSNNQRAYYNNGHGNAKSGFLCAMYDSILIGNDAGYNGEDGYTGYGGQTFNGNAAWNNLQRGFNIGSDSGFATTSALSATFNGNNSYDNEWAGYRISGNGAPLVVGCFARANGRGKVGADTDNANFVLTSTARGSGFVGCQSAAWDYDAVTPLTYFGFFVSNPTYKTAFSGNIDRGCTIPRSVSNPGNIIASDQVT